MKLRLNGIEFHWKYTLLGGMIIVGILILSFGFLQGVYGTAAIDQARRFMEGMGWAAVFVYVVLFIVGSFLFAPATALSALAPVLFGPWMGFLAILAGNMGYRCYFFSDSLSAEPEGHHKETAEAFPKCAVTICSR